MIEFKRKKPEKPDPLERVVITNESGYNDFFIRLHNKVYLMLTITDSYDGTTVGSARIPKEDIPQIIDALREMGSE
jgi:hypothetical protein